MIKKIGIILILLICLFTISAVSAEEIGNETDDTDEDISFNKEIYPEKDISDSSFKNESYSANNTEWYINSNVPINGNGTIENPYDNLQDALNHANNGDTIYILPGIYKGIGNANLEINKQLNIFALNSNVIFEGENQNCIFYIATYGVLIKGLTFKNCNSTYGGAICGANISVANSSFINNSATYGGAICGANISVANSSFINNSATHGGAIFSENNSTIINSNFINNFAYSHSGAIHSWFNINIINSTFINNIAYEAGGAICSNGEINISICNFINNSALGFGGAINYDANNGIILNSSFINNTAYGGGAIYFLSNNGSIISSSFINNTLTYGGYTGGGAVFLKGENITIINSEFINNNANISVLSGGAIYSDGNYLIVSDSNFTNNTGYSAGAIASASGSNNLKITNSIFQNNSGSTYGGALSAYGDQSIIFNSTFINNNAPNGGAIYTSYSINITDCNFIDNTANFGGAINKYPKLYFLLINNCNFLGNTAIGGGAIYSSSFDINNCNFTDNIANGDGGAIYDTGSYGSSSITKCNFRNNSANREGGAICSDAYNRSLYIIKCIFVNNSASIFSDINSHYGVSLYDTIFIPFNNNNNKIYHSVSASVLKDKCIVGGTIWTNSNNTLIVNNSYLVDVLAPNVTKYYKGSERFIVIVKDNKIPLTDKDVTITLNGVAYTRKTNSDGRASLAINLNSGVYNVTTEYDGIKVYSTVTIKDTVIANDFTKMFRNGTQYYGTFLDSQGNVLKGETIRININGVYYYKITDNNGMAKMNINLNPGTYVLTAENPISGERHTTTITVLPTIVENYDLTKYYKNASQYTLRLLGSDGKPVGAGEMVTLNINGVMYTRTSDASGYVKMNINLAPGTYVITADYNGLKASNTITVKPVLFANDLKMKYRDGSKFEAKVLDGQGRPLAGATVTFNVNGVFYTKVTDDDGIARLTINLPAGNYIITSSFNGLNAANNIKIAHNPMYTTIEYGKLDQSHGHGSTWQWDELLQTYTKDIYDQNFNWGIERSTVGPSGEVYYVFNIHTCKIALLDINGHLIKYDNSMFPAYSTLKGNLHPEYGLKVYSYAIYGVPEIDITDEYENWGAIFEQEPAGNVKYMSYDSSTLYTTHYSENGDVLLHWIDDRS